MKLFFFFFYFFAHTKWWILKVKQLSLDMPKMFITHEDQQYNTAAMHSYNIVTFIEDIFFVHHLGSFPIIFPNLVDQTLSSFMLADIFFCGLKTLLQKQCSNLYLFQTCTTCSPPTSEVYC